MPPSVEEVREYGLEYCEQRGYPPGVFDAEDFCDHWQSKGWKRGRTPMRDWRASEREWIRRNARDRGVAMIGTGSVDDEFSKYNQPR